MNTLLSTPLGRHDHPPEHVQHQQRFPVRRVSLLDRAALHLGVALISWGRRPLAVETRERRAHRTEQHGARLERERLAEKWLLLNTPRL